MLGTMNEHNTILIVDDTPAGRKVLERLLSNAGYRIAVADNGAEALSRAAELIPDLILLDVMMPGMDGFEVCRRLRADMSLSEVPIMFVTALGDRESRLLGIEAGADDFVTKPLDRIELQARVRAILRLNRYRRLLMERVQRQQAEEEVLRHEREFVLLKEAEQIKDRFVSTVSHELRTPLSVITLLVGNLETLYLSLDDDRRRAMIRDIRAQTRTLNELVESVLEIARIDGGRLAVDRQPVDLAHLVREETEKQQPLARKKGHMLDVVGIENLVTIGNDGQLRQVVRNLLNNAIKYTPDGGRIVWECCAYTAAAEPSATPDGERVWPGRAALPHGCWAALRVCDTGIGLAPEELLHVFERFYRVKSQGNISGTGLGLSIAQELVEAHGGRIAIASDMHLGSVFAVYLPLHGEA
jgi:two-component system, sensor histidine kinase and response regulator